ncbi:MAG: Maf family protein [Pseudomonadales bacterium]|nr:Maf family protein [Pseudomonadales bacterium]MDG2079928.1 Maf family protein [Pseudomonadales bacterium]
MKIVLGSSSIYRAQLLARILTDFDIDSPSIDETPLADEPPERLAIRLAREKAQAVGDRHPQSLVIGSDQVAILRENGGHTHILGKPGNLEAATAQLARCSGQRVEFAVACCLLNTISGKLIEFQDTYRVHYKTLSDDTIARYLQRDKPYDCAGSIKTEGLGIVLLASQSGSDPSTLIGLPLMALSNALESQGVRII